MMNKIKDELQLLVATFQLVLFALVANLGLLYTYQNFNSLNLVMFIAFATSTYKFVAVPAWEFMLSFYATKHE